MLIKKELVFFDVDYTLIDGNSGFFATKRLIQHKVLKKRRLIQAIYYTLAALLFDQDVARIYQIAIDDMSGRKLDDILNIGKECLESDLKKRLKPKALAQLKKHQNKGDHIVLLTSGPYMIMQNLADYLGISEFYAIGPKAENNILTNYLPLPICHGAGKIHYAKKAAKKNNISLADAYFYTDHHTDIPLLELVGHPQCVDPDFKLKNWAQKKKWPILNFKE